MSRRIRLIILAGIVLFVASCLYPPWEVVSPKVHRDYGWGPLWHPPYSGEYPYDVSVAWPRLTLEWAVIAAVTGGLVLVAVRDRVGEPAP
jgi:hypothetical protein